MKKCCFILKFIAMMLVVVLIFPLCLSLTGCNSTKKEIIAEMISRAYVSYGEDVYGKNGEYHAHCGYSNSLPFDVATPLIRTEAIAFSGGHSYTGEREINVNGEIHKAKSGQENLKSVYFDGTLASAFCIAENGESYNITYTQDTKELCSIEYFDRELWGLGAFDVGKGQRAAEEYVRTVLNDKYGKNIDLDEYELTAPNESSVNKNEFIWTKYEDGVALHTVTVVLNRQYEVDSFTAYPIPDKKQYSLYDVEASDYNEVTKHIVDTANGNARNGEFYSFYEETPPSPELVYLHPYGQYFVRYTKFIKATKGEEGHGCYVSVYIALDGVPTYTEPQKYDFIKSYDIPEGAYSFELIDSASRIVDSSAPDEIRVADIFGSDDFYPYKSYFYQYSYDSNEYGANTVLDIYTANGEQYGNAIEVDRNLGKVISFNNSNRPILDKEHLIEISVEEAEAIVSEFVREYYSEIDFGEYTLLYGGTGEDYLSEFSYAIIRNGFVLSRLKVELVSKHIRAFKLKPYDKSIEIPAYDDQTLLSFALAEEGITDPIVEYSISRGELVFGANFTYYLTYKAYVTTVDGNGRQQERQAISVKLPIKRCAPETELDILISHENRYLSFTEEQIYTDHGIPADTEGIKVTAFDSYSGPLTGENVEMLLGDRTVSFSPVSKHTKYYNYVPVGEINRYKYLDEIYSYVTLKTDSETGDLVSLVLEAEGEYEHRHGETLLDENEALQAANDFLKLYHIGFDPEEYKTNIWLDEEGDLYSIAFYKYYNLACVEYITFDLYQCGEIREVSIAKQFYTENLTIQVDYNMNLAVRERVLPYIENIDWVKKARVCTSVADLCYDPESGEYLASMSFYIILYDSADEHAEEKYYIPLVAYYVYDKVDTSE